MEKMLNLLARAYLTPQEISVETGIPLETVYWIRDGKPAKEQEVRKVLRVINSRLQTRIELNQLEPSSIIWE